MNMMLFLSIRGNLVAIQRTRQPWLGGYGIVKDESKENGAFQTCLKKIVYKSMCAKDTPPEAWAHSTSLKMVKEGKFSSSNKNVSNTLKYRLEPSFC